MNYYLLIRLNEKPNVNEQVYLNEKPNVNEQVYLNEKPNVNEQVYLNEPVHIKMSEDYTDTLKNIYVAPLQYQSCDFRQIGYLTNSIERLPFFGRKLNRHDRWVYYTLQNGIKLPIMYNNRECTQTPGCEMISDKDEIKIEGQSYTVRLYDVKVFGY